MLLNSLGEVVSRRDFLPFGEEIAPDQNVNYRTESEHYVDEGDDGVRQKFTGYQKDKETGLDFAEARMYENRHARFTAVDPLLASGKSVNPQTFNRYVYVANSPLILTDPTGLQAATNLNCTAAAGDCSVTSVDGEPGSYQGLRTEMQTRHFGRFGSVRSWEQVPVFDTSNNYSQPFQDYLDRPEEGIQMGARNFFRSLGNLPYDMSYIGIPLTPLVITPATFGLERPFEYEKPRTWTQFFASGGMQAGLTLVTAAFGPVVSEFRAASTVSNATKVTQFETGSFSIIDWTGYPSGLPRPNGPFRLLQGAEYKAARNLADKTNRALHRADPNLDGFQIHEIHPVKFGGSPTDISNKTPLTVQEHQPYNLFWKQLQRSLEKR